MKKFITIFCLILVSATTMNAQNWQWAQSGLGGAHNNEVLGTTINNNGEVFVSGYYNNTLYIVGSQLTSNWQGDYNSFMAKYNAAGTPIWCRNIDAVQPDANIEPGAQFPQFVVAPASGFPVPGHW